MITVLIIVCLLAADYYFNGLFVLPITLCTRVFNFLESYMDDMDNPIFKYSFGEDLIPKYLIRENLKMGTNKSLVHIIKYGYKRLISSNDDVEKILSHELDYNGIPKVLHKIIHLFLVFPTRFGVDDDWSCLDYIFGSPFPKFPCNEKTISDKTGNKKIISSETSNKKTMSGKTGDKSNKKTMSGKTGDKSKIKFNSKNKSHIECKSKRSNRDTEFNDNTINDNERTVSTEFSYDGAIQFSSISEGIHRDQSDILINGKRAVLEFELAFDRHISSDESLFCLNVISRKQMNNIKSLFKFYHRIQSFGKGNDFNFPIAFLKSEDKLKHVSDADIGDHMYRSRSRIDFNNEEIVGYLPLYGSCENVRKSGRYILRVDGILFWYYNNISLREVKCDK